MANHWLNKLEYPFESNFYEINGHKLHYLDEGQGDPILFVHGTPSWSFDFRNVIKELRTNHRCIAIDHIGFGLSDKPEQYDYSTRNHSKTLEKFILDKQLDNLTIVVHDFGGPIGLNFAIKYPHLIQRIVILNTWLWSSANEPSFIKLSKVLHSPLLPFLYRYFNFSARFLLPNSFGDKKISSSQLKNYTKPFSKPNQREGTIAFAKSLLEDQEWFEQLWQNRNTINTKPTLFIWGMKDSFVGPEYLAKFQSGFKNSETMELDKCGHFPQEEQPDEVVKALMLFLRNK